MRIFIPFAILFSFLAVSLMWSTTPKQADINLVYTEPFQTFDPQKMRGSEDIRMGYALFEGLTTFNPMTFEVLPGVAESWEVSEDGKTYTFHLRKDAKWSDGSPITSGDFKVNWRQGLMPDVAPQYIDFFYYIKGSREYFEWASQSVKMLKGADGGDITDEDELVKAGEKRLQAVYEKFDELVGAKFPDDYTIVVELYNPTPFFAEIAACWPLFPAHQPTLRKYAKVSRTSGMLKRSLYWTKPGIMVNNGPYLLKQRQFRQFVYLERNPNYWNQAAIKNNSVKLTCVKSKNTKLVIYEAGDADVYLGAQELGELTPDLIAKNRAGERKDVHDTNSFATYYFQFNCREKINGGLPNPFHDPRVRRAFTMAVNKKEIVEDVTRLYQEIATTMVPRNSITGYKSPEGIGYDPEGARKLLAEAGYPNGRGFPQVEVVYNPSGGHGNTVTVMQKQWQEVLNVKVKQEVVDFKILLDRKRNGNFMIARSGWFGDFSDPTTFLDMFRPDNGQNDGDYRSEAYEKLMVLAGQTPNAQKRLDILSQAETILADQDVPMIPLYYYKTVHLYRPGTHGVSLHPRNLQMFHYMYKDGAK